MKGKGEAARLHENEDWLLGIGGGRSSLGFIVFRLDGLVGFHPWSEWPVMALPFSIYSHTFMQLNQ